MGRWRMARMMLETSTWRGDVASRTIAAIHAAPVAARTAGGAFPMLLLPRGLAGSAARQQTAASGDGTRGTAAVSGLGRGGALVERAAAAVRCGATAEEVRGVLAAARLDAHKLASLIKTIGEDRDPGSEQRLEWLWSWARSAEQTELKLNVFHFSAYMNQLNRRQRPHSQAREAFEQMMAAGVQPNVLAYNTLLKAYCNGRQWHQARGLLVEMKAAGLEPDVVTHNTLIAAYAKGRKWELATEALEAMKAAGVQPNEMTYRHMLPESQKGQLTKHNKGTKAAASDELRGVVKHGSSRKEMVAALQRATGPEQLHSVLQSTQIDGPALTALLSAIVRGNSRRRVDWLWAWANEQPELKLNVYHYNVYITHLRRQRRFRDAEAVFEKMKAAGVQPNVVMYGAMITMYGDGGQWERAREAFEEMKAAGVKPDVVAYSAMLSAYGKGDQWERAKGVLEEMKAAGVRPDVITYNALISAYAKGGQVDRAIESLEAMKVEGFEVDTSLYYTLRSVVHKKDDQRKLLQLMKQGFASREQWRGGAPAGKTAAAVMQARGPEEMHAVLEMAQLDSNQLTLLIDVVGNERGPDHLHKLDWLWAWAKKQTELELNCFHYSAYITQLGMRQRLEGAVEAFEDMKTAGVHPDVNVYSGLITAYGNAGRCERAGEVLEAMKAAGVQPDAVTYSTLITTHSKARQWDLALAAFDAMKAAGIPPDSVAYNALISMYANGGQWELARAVLTTMRAAGVRPNVISYTTLVTAHGKAGQWQRASEVFEEMQAAGVQPDLVAYDALRLAYERGGQTDLATAVTARMEAARSSRSK
jgi:pentatricopeptide repeat protein